MVESNQLRVDIIREVFIGLTYTDCARYTAPR